MPLIERYWQRVTPLALLLFPLSVAFRLAVATRRALYRLGLLKSVRLAVPVVVIGNITVGGTGKTPLVLWLVDFLANRGLHPGIVSRGYGGRVAQPQAVTTDSDPAVAGDEPVMLARRCDAPVWVGTDRAAVAAALIAAHPDCNVILCDDGLQHYGLARDVEIAVIDGERGFGNGWMLPAGPLREPPSRLASVHAIVVNGRGAASPLFATPAPFRMTLHGGEFRNLLNPDHRVDATFFSAKRVHALAGIGNPERFFRHLQALGLEFTAHPFPDHHRFTARDLSFADAEAIVMTEKDAVKCAALATEDCWALAVDAEIDQALGELALQGIKRP